MKSKKSIAAALLLSVAIFTVTGCTNDQPTVNDQATIDSETTTESDQEPVVEPMISQNEWILELEENQTTGFTWHYIIEDESIVEVASDEYKIAETDTDMVGVGGTHTYVINPLSEGTTTIKFEYYQDWEPDTVHETKTYTVQVSPTENAGPLFIEVLNATTQTNIQAIVNESLEITLEENPTTGFTWHYTVKNSEALEVVTDEYTENEHDEGMVGVGGVHTYQIKPLEEGTATIKFEYYRDWEPDNIYDTREYIIEVSK